MTLYGDFLIQILTKAEEALETREKLQLRLEIMCGFHYTNFYEPPNDVTAQVSSVSIPPKRKNAQKIGQNLSYTVPTCLKPVTIDEHHVQTVYKIFIRIGP